MSEVGLIGRRVPLLLNCIKKMSFTETPEIDLSIRGSHLLNTLDISKYLCKPASLSVSELRLIGRSLLRFLVVTVPNDINRMIVTAVVLSSNGLV
jgi:hypothetical protein